MSLWDRLRLGRSPEPAASDADAQSVVGERGIPSIHRTRSIQSRVTNVLAVGLLSVLALGFLTWYYTQTFARQSRAQEEAQSSSKAKAQGEMSLPALGRVDSPIARTVLGPPPEPPPEALITDSSRENSSLSYAPSPAPYGAASARTLEQIELDRRLSGPVFLSASNAVSPSTPSVASRPISVSETGMGALSQIPFASRDGGAHEATPNARDTGGLAALLQPTATAAAEAKVLPTQRLLLAKGSFLDCTLETAIDSSLPGMTTCVTATDTFSVDGSVVLLERGTKLVGETRGDVRQGTARVYVLWTEARTPTGVVVPIASPGTDELGRAGLPGEVNRHFWERFGAAILVSVIDGAVQSAVQRSSASGAVIVNPSASRDVMTEILRSTINIPPTVTKRNGDRIAVFVVRDLDFRSVYELRPTASR